MPLVNVKMVEGRSKEQKEKLVAEITRAVVDICHVPKEGVWVVIEDVPAEHWGVAGTLLSDRK